MAQELAVIRGPRFGIRDTSRAMLWFNVLFLGGGSLLCFIGESALKFVQDNDISDISTLEGRSCIIDNQNNAVSFVKLFKE